MTPAAWVRPVVGGDVAKTVTVEQLEYGQARRAVSQAKHEPVLVSEDDRPAAWIIGAEALAQVAAARGVESNLYQRALTLLAVDLYRGEELTLAQAARLVGLPWGDFIDLCGRLHVPALWEAKHGISRDVDALASLLDRSEPDA